MLLRMPLKPSQPTSRMARISIVNMAARRPLTLAEHVPDVLPPAPPDKGALMDAQASCPIPPIDAGIGLFGRSTCDRAGFERIETKPEISPSSIKGVTLARTQ